MRFKNTVLDYFKVGIIFTIFMMIVVFIFTIAVSLIAVPPVILMDALGDPIASMMGAGFGLFLILLTFVVLGWAIMFFYKRNIFVFKRR
jgi:hypothetical protein